MLSPRSKLATELLGISASEIAADPAPNHGSDLLCKKRALLREQFEQVRDALSDKRIAEFVSYSKQGGETREAVLELLEAERARNRTIVERDRARVQAAKQAMEKSIKELVADEVARKDLEKRRQAQTAAFNQKLEALAQRRKKEAGQREKIRNEKLRARKALLDSQLAQDERTRDELQAKMEQRLSVVAKRKHEIKDLKRHEADFFNERLERVWQTVVNAAQERDLAAVSMHERLLDRMQRGQALRTKLLADWRARGNMHAQQLQARKSTRNELEETGERARNAQETESLKRATVRQERITANRNELHRNRASMMKTKDNARAAAVVRCQDDRENEHKRLAEYFRAKHEDKDRTRSNSEWDSFEKRRSDWCALAGYNLGRIKRVDEFQAAEKIAKMKQVNDKIEKLRNVDHVRAEKQKLLRANWLEKLRLEAIFEKLRRERNETRFSELIRDLSV